jgi:hypothetical protein
MPGLAHRIGQTIAAAGADLSFNWQKIFRSYRFRN